MVFAVVSLKVASCIMDNDNIVPDVADNLPSAVLNVKYPNGKQVNFGKELTPTEVKDEPTITWQTEPNKYYLLVMTDPDPAPEIKEVKHWLIGNIEGNDLSTGEILAEYLGSGPPKGTGLHRYIFFVYEQPDKIMFDEPPKTGKTSRANRLKFAVRNFAKKYNLGNPIAWNYYKAQWDDYVDERNKHMTNN